jgi:DNA mismatch repair protein MutS2
VPNDIALDANTRVLVISGPNTGGKTVFMKTVGMIALMVRAGMAIPAHPDSRIGFFPEVYAEIGDDQSLTRDLSSYSAHLLNLIAFLNHARNESLILVDEIFGSTDPEEGSALAIAILRELTNRSCITAVTTHNSRLKAFAENEPGFKNASFEFDPQNLTPTYHLRVGVPGPSYGIATAQKLGLEPGLVENALQLLEPEAKRIMDLVSQLDHKQTELDQRLRELETEEFELRENQRKAEERSSQISAREKTLKKEMRLKLEGELQSMRLRFNQIFEQAKYSPAKEVRAGAEKQITQIREEIEQGYPEPEMGEQIASGEWRTGDIAWVSKLRVSARVIEIDRKEEEATLVVGSIHLNEKLSGLRRIKPAEKIEPREVSAESEQQQISAPVQTSRNTLDLRGKRAEDAEIEVINYLDRAAREGVPAVFIIHGHGAGVLKKLVREYLAASSYVVSFRPGEQGEGGDGVSVAFLERMKK